MPVVRVEPLGVNLDVATGETVFAAAYRHGYAWPTMCYGSANCCECIMDVTGGAEGLRPPTRLERHALALLTASDPPPPTQRLACQTTVVDGGATVYRRGTQRLWP